MPKRETDPHRRVVVAVTQQISRINAGRNIGLAGTVASFASWSTSSKSLMRVRVPLSQQISNLAIALACIGIVVIERAVEHQHAIFRVAAALPRPSRSDRFHR